MQTKYSCLCYKTDLYFHGCGLAIKVDEFGYSDRVIDYEKKRRKAIEKDLDCKVIRINPDEKDFNVFKSIDRIHRRIKNSPKRSLIDKISRRLFRLKFQSKYSIKSRSLNHVVNETLPGL